MRVLIVYGTTEGHTREIANFAARALRERGVQATVEEAGRDASHPDPGCYDLTILAASLHGGCYQPQLIAFARANHAVLGARPSAFISVSLSAAGLNPHDWEGLDQCVKRFEQEAQWTPAAVHHAGGAILNSQYDFFKRLVIKQIAARRGQATVTSRDYDLTDYPALERFVWDFVGAQAQAQTTDAPASARS